MPDGTACVIAACAGPVEALFGRVSPNRHQSPRCRRGDCRRAREWPRPHSRRSGGADGFERNVGDDRMRRGCRRGVQTATLYRLFGDKDDFAHDHQRNDRHPPALTNGSLPKLARHQTTGWLIEPRSMFSSTMLIGRRSPRNERRTGRRTFAVLLMYRVGCRRRPPLRRHNNRSSSDFLRKAELHSGHLEASRSRTY